MWVPAGVLEAIGAMMALRHLMRLSTLPSRVPPKARRGGAQAAKFESIVPPAAAVPKERL
jgi:putative membrane protein